MEKLYPFKFQPIFKEKIWGGVRLKNTFNKKFKMPNCGESWELSGVSGNISKVLNGPLAGKPLTFLMNNFKSDLMGRHVYDEHHGLFPLLIKFIDANDDLSIQVHPDDKLALKRHGLKGKTEMWYILETEKNARLISGFNREVNANLYQNYLKQKKLTSILNFEKVSQGDVFFIPAGRVHAILKGICLAEIQQTSDLTYRIYDWDRTTKNGLSRELHLKDALPAIDYKKYSYYKNRYSKTENGTVNLIKCNFFIVNLVICKKNIEKNYTKHDSFIILICIKGKIKLFYDDKKNIILDKGETILLPALFKNLRLLPLKPSDILEIFLPG